LALGGQIVQSEVKLKFYAIAGCVVCAGMCLPVPSLAAGFVLGSGNTAVIEPALPHPAETPCVVTLFANDVFGANNLNYSYAPPAACPGPWAKVILKASIGLDKGIQYDRSGLIWLGGVNIWFGTTSEPTPTLAPHWQIEKDVTDDTALFLAPQTGFVQITNYTNSTDTSVITTSAQLLFYPATPKDPVPTVPDMVIGVGGQGGPATLNTGTSVVSVPLTLPKSVIGARLDLFTQGQSTDEFWYTCVPSSLSSQLEDCGSGAFREGEVSIDSTPAGVAPVYPWIFTGGIDPYLWSPMPGVQTLDFKPFPVNLTPFAGLLSNGAQHTLNVSVYAADSYFSVTGALYVYLDPKGATVTGAVTHNTLVASPKPTTKIINAASGAVAIDTASTRDFTISGYANTSAGRVVTTVHETSSFYNNQVFDLTDTLYDQQVKQDTETLVDVTQQSPTGSSETATQYSYPLTLSYVELVGASGSGQVKTTLDQEYHTDTVVSANGLPTAEYQFVNAITPTDTLLFNASGNITGNSRQSSTEVYATTGTGQGCFTRTLKAVANVLTAATTSASCK
jgi:hypothetical protein